MILNFVLIFCKMSSTLSVHRTAYPTCIFQCLCLVPLHLHLARFAELSVLRAGLCITILLIFLINHAACLWCCLLMSQHKKCIKLLEHSVIMLIFPADWEIYTRIHNMLCNLWFTQNTHLDVEHLVENLVDWNQPSDIALTFLQFLISLWNYNYLSFHYGTTIIFLRHQYTKWLAFAISWRYEVSQYKELHCSFF